MMKTGEGGNASVAGPAAGLGAGYLLDIGNIPFNIGLRYQHNFGNLGNKHFGIQRSRIHLVPGREIIIKITG
jgi:hypothetical protein